MEIFTIGHSRHTWELFLSLLKEHDIEVLVDVRSKPVSRYAPFSNKGKMPELLEPEGINYVFMGDSLGGKPEDSSNYDQNGKPNYTIMSSRLNFLDGIDELVKMAESSRVAIMCSEEDPEKCHRRLLIWPRLKMLGVDVWHVRGNNVLEQELRKSRSLRRKRQ